MRIPYWGKTIQMTPNCIYNVRLWTWKSDDISRIVLMCGSWASIISRSGTKQDYSKNDKNNSCHSIYSFYRYLHWKRLNSTCLTWHESYFASSFVFFQLTIIENSIDWKNMLPDIRVHYTFEKIWIWNKINHFCTGSMWTKLSTSPKSPTQKSFQWENSTIF